MKPQIVNIINFIRDVEPRAEVDLVTPVKEQIALMQKLRLRGTFLMQYDSLLDPVFTDMLRALDKTQFEIGVWLEIVQPQTEAAGIEWRGRYPWDWHSNVGFSVGYTMPERERLIDALFAKFKEVFGYYPRSLGSWAFDAHTVRYASEKYGLDAFCNCKEQYGTDGYTLWGGYYGQGYYPCKNNVHAPAQSKAEQINTPVFKMLGSDPIYQYDFGMKADGGPQSVQGVVTLEPVYAGASGGGGVPAWVDWYLNENFSGRCLSFGYAQAGQENSFGWDSMKNGLTYQFGRFAELQKQGKLICEQLCETGRRYKQTYETTPTSTVTALTDWSEGEHKSVWYSCARYRINVYAERKRFWIRDIYLFRDGYREKYFDELCTNEKLTFDNPPYVDGNVFSGHGVRAGLYPFTEDGMALTFDSFDYKEIGDDTVIITLSGTQCGSFVIEITPNGFKATAERDFIFKNMYDAASPIPKKLSCDEKTLRLEHRKFHYEIKLSEGRFISPDEAVSSGCSIEYLLGQ